VHLKLPRIRKTLERLSFFDMQCSSVSAGLKCVDGQCVLRKPCPNLRTPTPPEGCYYKSIPDSDGCVTPTLKCDQKKVWKRQIPECPRNSIYSNCTNTCGYAHCATMNHVKHCQSLRCGPPGCVCKAGHVFVSVDHSLGCVHKDECSKIVHKRTTGSVQN
uniref:TIL domain-containing protein n=1 Tax=Parascaris univalens TaxID=6257 RepID=A0A914ZL42_PARUN